MSKAGNKKRAGKHVSHANKKPYGSERRLIPDDCFDARSEARYTYSDTDAQTERAEAARWATGSAGGRDGSMILYLVYAWALFAILCAMRLWPR